MTRNPFKIQIQRAIKKNGLSDPPDHKLLENSITPVAVL